MEEQKNNNETESTVPTAEPVATTPPPDTSVPPTPPASESQTESSTRNMIIGIGLGVAILIAGYLYLQSDGAATDATNTTEGEDAVVFEPVDPAAEVARVNGVTLYGSDLMLQMVQAAQAAGLPSLAAADAGTLSLIQSQSLDAIVNTQLIVQTAQTEGITATAEEAEAEFATLTENIGGEEVANQRLAELGVSEDSFKENLRDDIVIRRYLEAKNDPASLAVSEEEIQAFYAQVTGGQTEGMPTLEDARAQIEGQLQFSKQQEILVTIIEGLRADATIEILI